MAWILKRYWFLILVVSLLFLLAIGWMVFSLQESDKLPLRGVYVFNQIMQNIK